MDGTEPVSADELVYRRVHEGTGFYDPRRPSGPLSPKAFKPVPCDTNGISFSRAKYCNADPAEAAKNGYLGKKYYVLELVAGDIQNLGLQLIPDPQPNDPGHALMPAVCFQQVNTPQVGGYMDQLRRLTYAAHGPFSGSMPPPPRRS